MSEIEFKDVDHAGRTCWCAPGQTAHPARGSGAPDPSTLAPDAPRPSSDLPSFFTALEEQLALKLEASREPVDVFVVNRLERPTLD